MNRFAVFALCALLGLGLPLYAPYAASGEGEPHALMAHGGGMPDCCPAGDTGVDCGQFCAAVCAGMLLGGAADRVVPPRAAERIGASPRLLFRSRAGPPALQPPR